MGLRELVEVRITKSGIPKNRVKIMLSTRLECKCIITSVIMAEVNNKQISINKNIFQQMIKLNKKLIDTALIIDPVVKVKRSKPNIKTEIKRRIRKIKDFKNIKNIKYKVRQRVKCAGHKIWFTTPMHAHSGASHAIGDNHGGGERRVDWLKRTWRGATDPKGIKQGSWTN